MHRLISLIFTLGFALSMFASTSHAAGHQTKHSSFPITITDDHGNKIRLNRAPTRIVSLDPRDTETLFAVGAEKLVVADSSQYVEGAAGMSTSFKYPSQWPSQWGKNYPTLSKQLPHIEGGCCGTHFDVERLTSLRPDVVLAPYSKTELPTFGQMRDLGMKVVILDPSNLEGIFHDISLVGAITGNSGKASRVVTEMRSQLRAVKAGLKRAHGTPRVYYEIDATNPTQPFTAGPGTFIDEAIHISGGKNVADSATTCSGTLCYPQFSLEALVRLNPQVILLGDAAYGTSPSDVKSRGGWETISAVKSGKIYRYNDELISRAGPRIIIGIRAMAMLIHPAAFKR